MSDFAVEVVNIDEIMPHPSADRLELARVKGWVMVVGKGTYKAGDAAVFFPIDSVLPPELEEALFKDSKIKLHGSRVRTCKIRGVISQGLLAPLNECGLVSYGTEQDFMHYAGHDWSKHLGVTKYEPPVNSMPSRMQGQQTSKRNLNPYFHEYHDIPRAKNVPYMFAEGELVDVTEKIRGTNFRAGWVPFHPRTLWQKVKAWFGLGPAYEFVYGSRRVQLQYKTSWNGFYTDNVYGETVMNYNLDTLLPKGVVIYGEIYGAGIQKGYTYGCAPGEIRLAVFDIEVSGRFLAPDDMYRRAQDLALPTAPMLYSGRYDGDVLRKLASTASVLCPSQSVIEGVVVKSAAKEEYRKVVKVINEEYDLQQAKTDGTDFH